MAMGSASCISLVVLVALATAASGQLSSTFYDTSCPRALATIKSGVAAAVSSDPRMGASLLRLHFHDCFVQGCDASVLLSGMEQNAGPNVGSLRGFSVIDSIKTQLESICKQTVSCADILTVAARDSVVALGGPSWTVPLGRRDSTTASASLANSDLPGPGSSRSQLEAAFLKKNLNTVDMVALSGAHTIGKAQCSNFRNRIYGGDTNINTAFATSLKANCPQSGGNSNLANLDTTTPNAFDNAYYTNLLSQKGLLHSDQVLFNNDTTDNTVRNFASNAAAFSSAFTTAMIKMGNIAPLTGTQGQIRLSCSKTNDNVGGSTLDVSVLSLKEGMLDVLMTRSDVHLSGDDFDRQLAGYFVELIQRTLLGKRLLVAQWRVKGGSLKAAGEKTSWERWKEARVRAPASLSPSFGGGGGICGVGKIGWGRGGRGGGARDRGDNPRIGCSARLLLECERAKRALSDHDQHQVGVEVKGLLNDVHLSETLTRALFEELNKDRF
ncbi:hypothetical protein VPH35_035001 [Triticum aestivum]